MADGWVGPGLKRGDVFAGAPMLPVGQPGELLFLVGEGQGQVEPGVVQADRTEALGVPS